ncbi:methyltransferase regulatory domain-containing protein [Corticimicrobacter populi]|nr:methyltransferase regulatory domain-containing protein [Corticimicrobacter populi]
MSTDRHTAPANLRAAAWLYGLDTAPLVQARVLELGCGTGMNLLPFALSHPQAQIVGIDIDPAQIEIGQARLAQLGVGNYQLFSIALDALLQIQDIGTFDYILVRGVFALLDAETRLALMRFCQTCLSENGIACFDYPVYPGARNDESLRDALLFHSGQAEGEQQQLDSARAMLIFLEQGLAAGNPQRPALQALVRQDEKLSDLMLGLKYLQGFYHPCYFIEFNGLLDQAGLIYVGDARPHSEIPESWGPETAQVCEAINPGGNKILVQQYLDFACGRSRRLSLVARRERAAQVLTAPDTARLEQLHWSGHFVRYQNEQGHIGNGHLLADGSALETVGATGLSMLDHIGYAWPHSVDYANLSFNTRPVVSRGDQADEQHAADASRALRSLFLTAGNHLHFSREALAYDTASESHLTLVPGMVAHVALESGTRICSANPWQETVSLDLTSQEAAVMALLDGRHGPVDWIRAAATHDSEEERATTEAAHVVLTLLRKLHAHGLLQGASSAWLEFYAFSIETELDRPEVAADSAWRLMMHTFAPEWGGIGCARPVDSREKSAADSRELNEAVIEIHRQLAALEFERAEILADNLVKACPADWRAWYERHVVSLFMGKYGDLLAPALRAMLLRPDSAETYGAVALSMKFIKRYWQHKNLLEKTLRTNPRLSKTWDHLGIFYADRQQLDMASLCSERAAKLDPENDEILSNLAGNYSNQMRVDEALGIYRRIIRNSPNKMVLYSNYLFVAQHASNLSAQQMFELHRQFGLQAERLAKRVPLKLTFEQSRNPEKRLNIGFISADLRAHAVSSFIEKMWASLDKSQFNILAYSNSRTHDDVSARLQQHTAKWTRVVEMSDVDLARQIHADGVDILVDLSGHTSGNRLPMMAFKPAPVQMSWIGYPATTGVAAIDYYIADLGFRSDPDVLVSQFVESLIYIPSTNSFGVMSKGGAGKPKTPAPCIHNGYVTFASLNRPQKLNDDILKAWAEILCRAGTARLLIGNMYGEDMIQQIASKMQSWGVAVEQLIFKRRMDHAEYMQVHAEIDVLLDTFPYTGGTTSLNAMTHGIPTLTLEGDTLAGKQGVVIMRASGLPEFVVADRASYVERAVALANDMDEIIKIRKGYRGSRHGVANFQVRPSFYFERALREAWQRFCKGTPRVGFEVGYDTGECRSFEQ